jgi:hypothetical protein
MSTKQDQYCQGVSCPHCRVPMKPGEPESIMFTPGRAEIIYVCQRCWNTTRRTVKDKQKEQAA